MNLGIKGKYAIVTAGSRGIGAAIAKTLMEEGAIVTVVSRTQPQYSHNWIKHDLSQGLFETSLCPSIVVHSLGGTAEVLDALALASDYRRVYRLNFEVAHELNRVFVPRMQASGWGRVVHVSSVAGHEHQGATAYCAVKSMLNAYVRCLGRSVAKDGVVVSSVSPGAVMTEGGYWDKASDDHKTYFLRERQAIMRFGRPEEIASVAAFLCSEKASFVTGSNWLVDGGQGRGYEPS